MRTTSNGCRTDLVSSLALEFTQFPPDPPGTYSDIFEYNFASQVITRLTSLRYDSDAGGAGRLSISPDGQHIVFERTTDPESIRRAACGSSTGTARACACSSTMRDGLPGARSQRLPRPPPPLRRRPPATRTALSDRHPEARRHPHGHRHPHRGREKCLPAAGAEELRGSAGDEHAHQHSCRDGDRHADADAHQHSDRDGNRHAIERRHQWPCDLQGSGRTGHRAAVAILRWVEDDHGRDDHHR